MSIAMKLSLSSLKGLINMLTSNNVFLYAIGLCNFKHLLYFYT